MGGQLDYVGIHIIFKHISGGMWIIYTEDYFGDMVLHLGFYFYRGSHTDKSSKGMKV